MTVAISHADHDHPNTPAARAKCRRELDNTHISYVNPAGVKPAQMTVVPRKCGDGGVVKGMVAAGPKNNKKPGTVLRTIGDLPDVPRMLAHGARLAWANDWEVKIGDKFNDTEARIVIAAPMGEIALVWKVSLPHGVWGVFFRPWDSSVTTRVDAIEMAFAMGTGEA